MESNPERTATRECHVDHDHKTNAIRGILCGTCNKALGYFRDQTWILRAAMTYLRNFEQTRGHDSVNQQSILKFEDAG